MFTKPTPLFLLLAICGPLGALAQETPQAATFSLGGVEVVVTGDLADFELTVETETTVEGVEIAHLNLESTAPAVPPALSLTWSMPAKDVHGHWTTATRFEKALGPDWGMSRVSSMLARNAPVLSLFGSDDRNQLTFAVSDALNDVTLRAGIREEDGTARAAIDLFTKPHPAVSDVVVTVRFDRRAVPYWESLGDVGTWWAERAEYEPARVPTIARAPMYSTWYSYHQSVDAASLLREVELSAELGYEAIIVDDGWQTLDSQRGYAYTGDWKPERIPDMKGFVDAVHDRGQKVLLWYAMSLVGEQSEAFSRFQGKYLRRWEGQNAYVLDPRYPEVREYIIDTYRRAISDWGVDGFKLDFLGMFVATESTVLEAGEGRDFASVNQATDRLMTDVMVALRRVNEDIMIEFRQPYIGPLMRKYGNMFRAGDAPNAAVDNRVRTVDLRLLSGDTAVHSDMFMWHVDAPVEVAALQFLNILFAVPQLSVRLEAIPPDHREMVKFYTDYWRQNQAVLLDGNFEARDPMANYPLVSAHDDRKRIVAVYSDVAVSIDSEQAQERIDLVNAKASERIVVDPRGALGRYRYETVDERGRASGDGGVVSFDDGPVAFDVPPSGMVRLVKLSR